MEYRHAHAAVEDVTNVLLLQLNAKRLSSDQGTYSTMFLVSMRGTLSGVQLEILHHG